MLQDTIYIPERLSKGIDYRDRDIGTLEYTHGGPATVRNRAGKVLRRYPTVYQARVAIQNTVERRWGHNVDPDAPKPHVNAAWAS